MPRRRPCALPPAPLALALAALLLAGCGAGAGGTPASGAGASSSAAESAAQTSAAAAGGEVAQDLTFSGPLSGHMAAGHRGAMYVCTGGNFAPQNPNTKGQLVVGPIVGQVGGKDVAMSITKIDYHGPGSYDAGGVAFDVGSDHYYPAKAPSGTLTVNQDGRGGTVSMDLAANSDPATAVGHVQGTWRCPADAF